MRPTVKQTGGFQRCHGLGRCQVTGGDVLSEMPTGIAEWYMPDAVLHHLPRLLLQLRALWSAPPGHSQIRRVAHAPVTSI